MADARALLQASRNERRIKHPHASYTSAGKLTCNLCEVIIKHESAWQSHLHTTQHNLRLTRAREASHARNGTDRIVSRSSKKRKADDLDSPSTDQRDDEERKKARATRFSDSRDEERGIDTNSKRLAEKDDEQRELHVPDSGTNEIPFDIQPEKRERSATQSADLEAFEQELAELEASVPTPDIVKADATISSAPKSVAELIAEAREEQSVQREKRNAEREGEREDAARLLEDEFEEMEGLEQRAKRLRERMQALRDAPVGRRKSESLPDRTIDKTIKTSAAAKDSMNAKVTDKPFGDIDHNGQGNASSADQDHEHASYENYNADDDDNDDDNDDDDYWQFGAQ